MRKVVFQTISDNDFITFGPALIKPFKQAFLYTDEPCDLTELDKNKTNVLLSDFSELVFKFDGLDYIKNHPGGKLYEIGPIKPGEEDVIREKYEK
jgi:hypothetical protein